MEYSIKPKRFGRKENNPLPSKEDNWIIRVYIMKKIVLATFIAGLVLCQGNMALAAEPGLSSQATETTSETTDKNSLLL